MGSRPLRWLVVSNLFDPDRGGGSAVYSDLCWELAARGHDVTVLCAYPYFPEWQDKSGGNGLAIRESVERGVRVRRHGLFIPPLPRSTWQRALYEASLTASMVRSLRRVGDVDVVLSISTMVAPVAVGALAARVLRAPFVINAQDLSALAASATQQGAAPLHRALDVVERALYRRADVVTAISPVMAEHIQTVLGAGRTVEVVPNWVGDRLAETIRAQAPSPRAAGDPLRIVYAGNIGRKQDLLAICRTLAATSRKFVLRIFGTGAGLPLIEEWMASSGDARFSLGPFLDDEGFARELVDCDLFLIPEAAGSGAAYMPSKLLPALEAGAAILAVSDRRSGLGDEVLTWDLGPHLTWDRLGSLESVLQGIADDPPRLAAWRANALARARHYDRAAVIEHLEEVVATAVDAAGPQHSRR